MAKAGIEWDSTLGYADVAGFRLGVCHPIPLFDPARMQPFGIQEHPLIVMDCTLTRSDYMALPSDAASAHCRHLLEQTRRHNGEFVLLWHNTEIAPHALQTPPGLYPRVLREAASRRQLRPSVPGRPGASPTSGARTGGVLPS